MGDALLNYLRRTRQQIEQELADAARRRYYSPVFYVQYRMVLPLIEKHLQGRVIDLGSGYAPFRRYMPAEVTSYDTLDYSRDLPDLTYVSDLQSMPEIPDGAYDAGLCLEVLEHLPEPLQALREIHRILRPGGVLLLSVPHLSRLHDVPFDFYRFTRHGLEHVLEAAGFETVTLVGKGGLFSFLGHQVSTAILTLSWRVPIVGPAAWCVNKWCVTVVCAALDQAGAKAFGPDSPFVLGYVALGRKPRAL
jgi:SAM-dependent methyltransferase